MKGRPCIPIYSVMGSFDVKLNSLDFNQTNHSGTYSLLYATNEFHLLTKTAHRRIPLATTSYLSILNASAQFAALLLDVFEHSAI